MLENPKDHELDISEARHIISKLHATVTDIEQRLSRLSRLEAQVELRMRAEQRHQQEEDCT